ncbi:MAG: MerR family transcriptional regulator [Myxococcales bacterium]
MTYRIRTVSEMTGIPRNTLIAWERRYGFVRPERHDNSYRSYSDHDVAKIKRVKEAMDTGLTVSEAIAMLDSDHASHAQVIEPQKSEAAGAREASAAIENDPFRDVRTRLYDALKGYCGAQSERIIASLLGIAVETRIHRIYLPILRQIGDEWEAGRISIAQEHYASSILREQFVSILVGLGRRGSRGAHAACTTFPGDMHELGAIAMAVRLSQAGYHVENLGPNLPASEVGEFCRSNKPTLVCVSAILKQESSAVVQYARELRKLTPSGTRLVLGGRGVALEPRPRVKGVELVPSWEGFWEEASEASSG